MRWTAKGGGERGGLSHTLHARTVSLVTDSFRVDLRVIPPKGRLPLTE